VSRPGRRARGVRASRHLTEQRVEVIEATSRGPSAFGRQGPAGLPTTIILDAEHRVASRLTGAVTARALAPRLNELLAEDGS
jgi:hypothetical protein